MFSIPKDKQKIQLAKLPSAGTTFMVGLVPVYINFDTNLYLTMNATLDGNAKAGPFLSVGPQISAEAKWSYKLENGKNNMDFKANAKAGFKGEVGAKLKVFGYPIKDWSKTFDIGGQATLFEYPKKK